MFETTRDLMQWAQPPAIVVEVKDEQAMKREWDEACADEQDAVERKVTVLREALKRWPMVPSSNPGQRARGLMVYSPEMRRFVRDVLGLSDQPNSAGGGMNVYAVKLLKRGAEGTRAATRESKARTFGSQKQAGQLRRAVVELTTKHKLGANGDECMTALAKFYEEISRG